MKNRKNRKKRKYFHLTLNEIVIFVLIGLALILLFPFIFTKFSIGISYDNIGDTIGGISAPFLSFFGSILVYLALKSQVKANKDVQKQFKKQELKDYTQNFENIFFNLLTIHHQIVENIDFNANDILDDNDLSLYFSRYHLTLIDDIKKNNDLKSRDVFKFSFKVLRQLYLISFENHKDYDSDGRKNTYLFCPKSRITFENITEEVYLQGMYDKIYFKLNTDLGHYFRNLYQIIKRVDVANFSDDYLQDYKIKYSYTSIIRAQL